MKYINLLNPGKNSQLVLSEGAAPQISPTQILVAVKTTAVNRADLLQRQGHYPQPPGESPILGLEVAGEVVAIGTKVTLFKPGDRVYGLTAGGAYAQLCPVEESLAHCLPAHWSYTFAAAIPEALTTVYGALYSLGNLQSGQTILIHGAGSGISSLAIQMAKVSKAAVITTVGSCEKTELANKLGADQVIPYKEVDFSQVISPDSIDLILDFVGGDYLNKHLQLLKTKGRLIQIACMNGAKAECFIPLIISKRLQIMGFVLRSQSVSEKAVLWKEAHERWFELLQQSVIEPVIDSEFNLEQVEDAHLRMRSSQHFGKIIIHI